MVVIVNPCNPTGVSIVCLLLSSVCTASVLGFKSSYAKKAMVLEQGDCLVLRGKVVVLSVINSTIYWGTAFGGQMCVDQLSWPCLSVGVLLPKEELEAAAAMCAAAGTWLVLDNTYEDFLYEGRNHHTMSGPNVMSVFSFSKAYGESRRPLLLSMRACVCGEHFWLRAGWHWLQYCGYEQIGHSTCCTALTASVAPQSVYLSAFCLSACLPAPRHDGLACGLHCVPWAAAAAAAGRAGALQPGRAATEGAQTQNLRQHGTLLQR
jgi:hypothetical protein